MVRPPNPAVVTKARVYRSGFGTELIAAGVTPSTVTTPVNYEVIGGRYIAPLVASRTVINPNVLLDLPTGGLNNAEILFDETDSAGIASVLNPDIIITIGAGSKLTIPKKSLTPSIVNPASTTLKATASTGLFSGSASLVDNNPVPLQLPVSVKRSVPYNGLVIRRRESNGSTTLVGVGYFLLDRLPATGAVTTTTTTSPKNSGLVTFQKKVP